MASATGIPERVGHRGEEEPLLGRPGDVRQEDEKPFLFNVWIGEDVLQHQVTRLD